MPESIKSCWVLTEGIAGTENQCIGVAEALGLTPIVKRIKLRAPWKQLSPYLPFGHAHALAKDSDRIDAPYPDIVIASGRKAIGLAAHIRKQSGGKTFVVYIQDPRIDPKNFDLVVVPQHDPTRGENVIVTKTSLHRVTPEKLAEGKKQFEKTLHSIPHPRAAVLIGGSNANFTLTAEKTKILVLQLQALVDHLKTGLMITASRRTGEENAKTMRDALGGENVYFWDGIGANPYFGLLAMADYIIVTEDSVSMTSEALATGKPVYVVSLEGGAKRLNKFHKLLQEQGYTRLFTGQLEKWSYTPPLETERVADAIRKRIKERR